MSQTSAVIRVLSQDVVDRIAAGEVIQRPCNAVKELVENALDANGTDIIVTVETSTSSTKSGNGSGGGIAGLSVSDNGNGMGVDDLALACTRHATSKLRTEHDLSDLLSFGFRGEALASISLVSRELTITSRTRSSNVAYKQTYREGKPVGGQNDQKGKPVPCARATHGTSIVVDDLMGQLRHRQRSMRPADEYNRILVVLQSYAIHKSGVGVSLVCEKKSSGTKGKGGKKNSSPKVDLNTRQHCPAVAAVRRLLLNNSSSNDADVDAANQQQQELQQKSSEATKQAVLHVYGPQLAKHLHEFASSLVVEVEKGEEDDDGLAPDDAAAATAASATTTTDNAEDNDAASYSCRGFVSLPSYPNSKATCIFFFNDRLVDCPPLKRCLEDVYGAEGGSGSTNKPWCYLSLRVPPHHVDVNVHPSKQQVTLLYVNEICRHVADTLRRDFRDMGQSFGIGNDLQQNNKAPSSSGNVTADQNPNQQQQQQQQQRPQTDSSKNSSSKTNSSVGTVHNPYKSVSQKRNKADNTKGATDTADQPPNKKKRPAVPPSQFVRTHNATQVGALEPFLVPRASQQSSQRSSSSTQEQSPLTAASQLSTTQTSSSSPESTPSQQHDADCPLSPQQSQAVLDLSQPGAFAAAAAKCTCRSRRSSQQDVASAAGTVRVPRQAVMRPRKVVTDCRYRSIKHLRSRVEKQACPDLAQQLRGSYFVGVVSAFRSLVQCGPDLVLVHHVDCARHLFYQLALFRFAQRTNVARFKTAVDITQVMAQTLQLEEVLCEQNFHLQNNVEDDDQEEEEGKDDPNNDGKSSEELLQSEDLLPVSETNQTLAEQAADCLFQHAKMLQEYFSIVIDKDDEGSIHLSGLPVLLDGYAPPSHYGLSLFLLRLATEVNFAEERPCFHGVCRELGAFYASMPHEEADWLPHVRHVLFPALSTLLVPPQSLTEDGSFVVLTQLSRLYKVFERC